MAKNTICVAYESREFHLVVTDDHYFHGAMINVNIYEHLPNRKIFKYRWLDTRNTWTSDHASIEDGAKHLLALYLKEEADKNAERKKWEDFEKRG